MNGTPYGSAVQMKDQGMSDAEIRRSLESNGLDIASIAVVMNALDMRTTTGASSLRAGTFTARPRQDPFSSEVSDRGGGVRPSPQPLSSREDRARVPSADLPAYKWSPGATPGFRISTDSWIGLAICAVGIVVTVGSYYSAAAGGGRYLVAWGAILFGAIRFLRGLGR
jgi:hypothetical protein